MQTTEVTVTLRNATENDLSHFTFGELALLR